MTILCGSVNTSQEFKIYLLRSRTLTRRKLLGGFVPTDDYRCCLEKLSSKHLPSAFVSLLEDVVETFNATVPCKGSLSMRIASIAPLRFLELSSSFRISLYRHVVCLRETMNG